VTITNADEQAYLYNLALSQNCWIGLNDIVSEGKFEWQRGGNGYLNFNSGEPNNVNNDEDCVCFRPDWAGLWNDLACSVSLVYICQTCEPGKYSGVGGTPVCKPCPSGSIAAMAGASTCSPCPYSNSIAPTAGASSCSPCPANHKAVNGTVCVPM